jgi:hypothetical protein
MVRFSEVAGPQRDKESSGQKIIRLIHIRLLDAKFAENYFDR